MLKEKIKTFFAICIIIITIPYIITFFFQKSETTSDNDGLWEIGSESSSGISEKNASKTELPQKETQNGDSPEDAASPETPENGSSENEPSEEGSLETGIPEKDTEKSGTPKNDVAKNDTQKDDLAKSLEMDIDGYLVGVVAKQIPLDYQMETIKAQAVIARTALAAALDAGDQALPNSMSQEEMITLWGQDGFETNYHMLEEAIRDTQNEILTYDGTPILAAFHAVSAGKTRNGEDASIENAPYLASTDSSLDIPSPDFLKVTFLEKKDFLEKIQSICPELEAEPEQILELFTIEGRDGSGYVTQANAGGFPLSGDSLRECLGLNSACFYIKEVEGKVRIVTKGLGHGLGLSQYAANEMAKSGMDYQEILQYFYKNAELSSL